MKNFTKICLIISLTIACIGIICLCAGIALGSGLKEVMELADRGGLDIGNWHVGRWALFYQPDEEDEDVEVQKGSLQAQFLESEVESLDIDIRYGEVLISDSESGQIEINIDAPRRNSYQCKNDNGTLTLKDKTSRTWRNNKVRVTIAIPEGKTFEQVELVTNAGTIDIAHHLAANELDLELDAGEMTAENLVAADEFSANVGAGRMAVTQFQAGSMDVECGLGEVEICGSVAQDADIKCGMGFISLMLDAKEDDYDYEVSCGLGSVSVNGEHFSSLSTDKGIDHHAGRKVRLDCGMGEISVQSKED